MSLTDLETVKEAVDAASFDFDDVRLQRLTDAAEVVVERYIRCSLVDDFPDGLPADLRMAVIELVRCFYDAGPMPEGSPQLPGNVRALLASYRRFV